mgnify:CR=1 FL=1|jgi:hypothetical protein
MNTLSTWLIPKELDEEYKVSITKGNRLRREKKIPFSKIGNAVMYKRSDIEAWLDNHKVN